jgi:hypothetical protein
VKLFEKSLMNLVRSVWQNWVFKNVFKLSQRRLSSNGDKDVDSQIKPQKNTQIIQKIIKQISNESSFWLFCSLIAAILFAFSGLKIALQSPDIIQDDARQYLFWMQQFYNNNLFKNDLIADYFQSVTPIGFITLYKVIANLGIDLFFFNKVSTLILGLATTIYCFRVCLAIFPIPFAGFISSLLLNQNLWMVDDLSSGTPRAYIYVLVLAFLDYLLRQNFKLCLLLIVLQGLFYPQAVLITVFVLILRILLNQKDNRSSKLEFWCLFLGVIILVIYNFQISSFAPVITADRAKLLPEFLPGGRSAFFGDRWQFWLTNRRSGFFPIEWQYSLMCAYGVSLWWLSKFPNHFPLVLKIKPKIGILLELFLASVCLFFLAHLFLFKLHLPGRYTHHTLRIIIALIDGITITVLIKKLINKVGKNRRHQSIIFIILLSALLYPTYAVQSYPERLGYVTGESQQLYQFLRQQPENTLIATLSKEADFIPSLAARSVLVAEEYAIPYHQGYYQQMGQRIKDLIAAQYSSKTQAIANFIEKYNISLWLLDRHAFTKEYLQSNRWLKQYQPETNRAINLLQSQQKTVLELQSDRCAIFQNKTHLLLDTKCLKSKGYLK